LKKILVSLIALILVLGLVGGGSFASFSDTETSLGNTFTAGTLDLEGTVTQVVTAGSGDVTFDNEGGNFAWIVTDVAPGSAGKDVWTLTNIGSLPGDLSFTVSSIINNDNDLTEPEATDGDATGGNGEGELGANMYVVLWIDLNSDGALDSPAEDLYAGTLDNMALAYANVDVLAANGSVNIVLSWSIASNVGNLIQSDSASFDIKFDLDQIAVV